MSKFHCFAFGCVIGIVIMTLAHIHTVNKINDGHAKFLDGITKELKTLHEMRTKQ